MLAEAPNAVNRRAAPNWVTGAALAAALLVAGAATAHPEFSAVVTNRYVKLDLVGPDELRLAYTVMYGAAPAAAQRKLADANADGRLDDAETHALGARLRDEVARGLDLRVDGRPASLRFEEPVVGLAGVEVGPSPFSVDLVARVRCDGRAPHTLRLDDATPLPQLGESELRIEEGPGTQLLAAHRGSDGDERQTRFLFRGPKFSALEDRSITLRFGGAATATSTTPRSGQAAKRIGLALGMVLAMAVLLLLVRRRRANAA